MASTSPIRDSIGAALRFVREEWRFVAIVAGAATVVHTAALLTVGSALLVWLAVFAVISSATYAAFTRAALSGMSTVRANLARDAGRVFASMAIVGFFCVLVAFLISYVAGTVLIAPYEAEVRALENDQDGLLALMQRAIEQQPGVIAWALIIGFVVLSLLTSRFYAAAPASVESGRVLVFEAWRQTRGHLWRIVIARVTVLVPALIFAGSLQSLLGMALGLGTGDPAAIAAQAGANPLGFLMFFAGAVFLQTAIYTALEAGLSAALYRTLKPAPAVA